MWIKVKISEFLVSLFTLLLCQYCLTASFSHGSLCYLDYNVQVTKDLFMVLSPFAATCDVYPNVHTCIKRGRLESPQVPQGVGKVFLCPWQAELYALYLVQMHRLELDDPNIHNEFVKGNFCVNNDEILFCAIGPDQATEHANGSVQFCSHKTSFQAKFFK